MKGNKKTQQEQIPRQVLAICCFKMDILGNHSWLYRNGGSGVDV